MDPPDQTSQSSPSPTISAWNPVNAANWYNDSEDKDDSHIRHTHIVPVDNLIREDSDNEDNSPDTSAEHLNLSADELSQQQAEDALSDLHNLLYLHGPIVPTPDHHVDNFDEGDVILDVIEDEQDNIPEGDDNQEDSLPDQFQYLCHLHYNQPR